MVDHIAQDAELEIGEMHWLSDQFDVARHQIEFERSDQCSRHLILRAVQQAVVGLSAVTWIPLGDWLLR